MKNLYIGINAQEYCVSTQQIKIPHSWINKHSNVSIYETMVFQKLNGKTQYDNSLYNKRYTTLDNAKEGHEYILAHLDLILKDK